jgi:Family of unknown function (DUF5675)
LGRRTVCRNGTDGIAAAVACLRVYEMNLTLTTESNDGATTGELTAGDRLFFTIEQPWRNNAPMTSCVPAGMYFLVPYNSPTHGPTWCLRNVVLGVMGCDVLTSAQIAVGMRNMIEIHSANWAEQLEGCIALGLEGQPMLDPMTGTVEPAVENSRDAVEELLTILTPLSTGHTLTIDRQGLSLASATELS